MRRIKKKILAVGLAVGVVLGSTFYCPTDSSYVDAYSKTSTRYWTKKQEEKLER